MDAYIEIACDDCGKILPANMAYRRNVKVKSGTTEWNSPTYVNGQKTVHHHSVAHYSHQTLSLCEPCESSRRDAEKLRFWATAIGLLVVAAIIFFNVDRPSASGQGSPAEQEMEASATGDAHSANTDAPFIAGGGGSPSDQVAPVTPLLEESAPEQPTVAKPYTAGDEEEDSATDKVSPLSKEQNADLEGLY